MVTQGSPPFPACLFSAKLKTVLKFNFQAIVQKKPGIFFPLVRQCEQGPGRVFNPIGKRKEGKNENPKKKTRLHSSRTPGGYNHHRNANGTAPARRSGRPRSGTPGNVHEQPKERQSGIAKLRVGSKGVSGIVEYNR